MAPSWHVAPPALNVAPSFQQLLEDLGAEHERQVAELRAELAETRIASHRGVSGVSADINDSSLQQADSGEKEVSFWRSTQSHGSSYSRIASSHCYTQRTVGGSEMFPSSQTGGLNSSPFLCVGDRASSHGAAVIVTPTGTPALVRVAYEPFRLWPEWTTPRKVHKCARMLTEEIDTRPNEDVDSSSVLNHRRGRCKRIVSPSNPGRIFWEMCGSIVLGYDLLTIPMQVFDMPSSPFTEVVTWTTLLYWSVDLPASFCVGYFTRDGELVMAPGRIARHYASTWLFIDLLLITCDWIAIIATLSDESDSGWLQSTGIARLGKALRAARVLRLLRLLRLKKLSSLMIILQDMIGSEWLSITLRIFKNVACIVFINHIIACCWYQIGTVRIEGFPSWVKYYDYQDQPWVYKYWSCLHWSITQFTPGSMQVQPQNVPERIFTIIVLLFAMIVFSGFVSSVTNAMALLFSRNSQESHQMWVMRKYLDQNHITRDLVIRSNRYITNVLETKRKFVQHQDVEFLSLLSGPLLNDLLFELHSAHILVHPFLGELRERQPAILRKLCSCAVTRIYLSCGDELFGPGSICTQMYFVVSGLLVYMMQRLSVMSSKEVGKGGWFSEAVLWTQWHHRGVMCAMHDSQLVALTASKFREVLTQEYQDVAVTKIYGGAFVKALNDMLRRDNGYSLSDLLDDVLHTEGVKKALAGELEENLEDDVSEHCSGSKDAVLLQRESINSTLVGELLESNEDDGSEPVSGSKVSRKIVQTSSALHTICDVVDDVVAQSAPHANTEVAQTSCQLETNPPICML